MPDHKPTIDIVIVDDHPVVIEGLKKLLASEPAFFVKAYFTRGGDFIDYLEGNTVDVVLLDITLPDGNGIEFCREISAKYHEVKVLAVSNLSEQSIIRQMLQSGAVGYMLKTADARDILDCIRRALEGEIVFSKEITDVFDPRVLNETSDIPELTKREKQILKLLAEGKKSAEIAKELFISPLTVKTHRATLLQKFETSNIVTAINKARESGILPK
jgi:Response regulator containing a CheY-like receiver domain and an HTH DNA-binding domain